MPHLCASSNCLSNLGGSNSVLLAATGRVGVLIATPACRTGCQHEWAQGWHLGCLGLNSAVLHMQERAQTRHAANAGAEEGAHRAALAMQQVCCGPCQYPIQDTVKRRLWTGGARTSRGRAACKAHVCIKARQVAHMTWSQRHEQVEGQRCDYEEPRGSWAP